MKQLILWILFLMVGRVYSHRILMLLPVVSPSVRDLFLPIAHSLSKNGHDVVLLANYDHKHAKEFPFTYLFLEKSVKFYGQTVSFNPFSGQKGIMLQVITKLDAFCEVFLEDPATLEAMERSPDLIILPGLMNECGLIFVEKFKVPFIYLCSTELTPWLADLVQNPIHPSIYPNPYLNLSYNLTFFEKKCNSFASIVLPLLRRHYLIRKLNRVAKRYFQNEEVSLAEVDRNVSLILVNSDRSFALPFPLLPNVIEVGGIHLENSNYFINKDDLDYYSDVMEFMEKSAEGKTVIVSFGAVTKSENMPDKMKNSFIEAFTRLSEYKFIWKYEGERPKNLSSNVITKAWIPQKELLGHKSIGALLSHCGLLSIQEAVYHGIPVVGIPLFADQYMNCKRVEHLGIGIALSKAYFDADTLSLSLLKVLKEPSFKQNILSRSKIMKNRLITPLEKATFYIENVITYKGAHHLRLRPSEKPTWKYYQIEVIFLCILIHFLIYFMYLCCKKLFVLVVRLILWIFSRFSRLSIVSATVVSIFACILYNVY